MTNTWQKTVISDREKLEILSPIIDSETYRTLITNAEDLAIYMSDDHALCCRQAEISWNASREQTAQEIFGELKKKLVFEQCDPDTMAYFTDYFTIEKDDLQDIKKQFGVK